MNGASITPQQDPAEQRLVQAFEQLQPELRDFPVGPLLDLYVRAARPDRSNAWRLLDFCLGTWIAGIEGALVADDWQDSETAGEIQGRQRGARDALAQLKLALSQAETGRPGRGQLS